MKKYKSVESPMLGKRKKLRKKKKKIIYREMLYTDE